MKKIIICSALLLAFFSCSKDQTQNQPANSSGNAIEFNSSLNLNIARGTPVEGTKLKQNFGVFGYCDPEKNSNVAQAMEYLDPDFMYNQKVDYHGGNNPYFSYSPICYWPSKGWVNFFAYTPYHNNSSDEFVHPHNRYDKGYPYIHYEVCDKVKDQEDLMVADALKQVGTSCIVNFDFKHVLTKVGVEACLHSNCGDDLTVYITKVEFKNVKNEGDFYYSHLAANKDTWWKCVEGSKNYNIGLCKHNYFNDEYGKPKYEGVHVKQDCVTRVNEDDEYLLAIPQCFDNCKTVLEVTYCIHDGRNEKICKVEIPLQGTKCWEPGTCIDYVICIELNAVKFEAHVTPWTECEKVTTEICPSGIK